MSIILYNKLVRDKVPEQIERSGKSCTVEVVDDDQYRALLDRKLDEEMDSYQAHRAQSQRIWITCTVGGVMR